MAPADERRLAQAGARLAAASAGSPVFVLRPQAGSLYLASGVQNPTPFDMPAVTAVGRPGTPELLSQLSRGAIPLVCIDPDSGGGLRLIEVEAFVLDHFERTSDIGPCALYRAGGRAAEFSSSSP